MSAKRLKGSTHKSTTVKLDQFQTEFEGLAFESPPEHVKTLMSAVTTAWGVDWDEVFIARDLMQNFFDANRGRLAEVAVHVQGSDVIISAPTPFNLERLFYLGSEKDEQDVGQYGEGFKVAATCLLRDHGVTPIAQCGSDLLVLRIADQAVAGTDLYPVQYDFYRTASTVPGMRLILRGCSRKLAGACQNGLSHFFHEANPLVALKRWSYGSDLAIYDSHDGRGHLFYRNLKRGEIEGVPLVLVINKPAKAIENKISRDRDRNAFGEPVLKLAYRQIAGALKWSHDAQRVVVESAREVWERGHPLLSEIADKVGGHWNHSCWPEKLSTEVFGDRYYARSTSTIATEQLEFSTIEQRWRDQGRKPLPNYFRCFGVIDAGGQLEKVKKKADEESKRRGKRLPTGTELCGIQALSAVTRELAPEIMAVLDRGMLHYAVTASDIVLGQLKRDRGYRAREIYLAAKLFEADFAQALAVFLHEHAHIFGHDGDRGFTDALTELIEAVIRHRDVLDRHAENWDKVCNKVARERKAAGHDNGGDEVREWLDNVDEAELRALVGMLSPLMLKKLRERLGIDGTGKGGV